MEMALVAQGPAEGPGFGHAKAFIDADRAEQPLAAGLQAGRHDFAI